MRAASKQSNVSLRRHAVEKPFTVRYEGTDVSIPGTVKIHFKNVVSPGSQLKRANLRRNYHHYKAKVIDTCILKWAFEVLPFSIAAYQQKVAGISPPFSISLQLVLLVWPLVLLFPAFHFTSL